MENYKTLSEIEKNNQFTKINNLLSYKKMEY
jgi:hypothetical protein